MPRHTVRLPVVYLLHSGNADETQWPDVGIYRRDQDEIGREGQRAAGPADRFQSGFQATRQTQCDRCRSGVGISWVLIVSPVLAEMFHAAKPITTFSQSNENASYARVCGGSHRLNPGTA